MRFGTGDSHAALNSSLQGKRLTGGDGLDCVRARGKNYAANGDVSYEARSLVWRILALNETKRRKVKHT